MRIKNNKSGFVLLLSVFLLIFLGILLEASSLRANIELQRSRNRLAAQQAFYAAESGLAYALDQLRISASWNPDNPATPPPTVLQDASGTTKGSYLVHVSQVPDYENIFPSVKVESIGYSQMFEPTQLQRAILAQVVVENPTNFFLSTAGDLHVVSGAAINQDIMGNNVYFDVNQSLPAGSPQKDISIGGNALFLQSVHGNTDPAVSIKGVTQQSPTQTFSGVNTDTYTALAQNGGTYCTGDLTLSSTISKNSPELQGSGCSATPNTNGVVFATGNINISGTVSDNMIIIAGGNVYIDDNITVSDKGNVVANPQSDPNAAQVGILAKGDVIIPPDAPSDLTVDAFVMADGGAGSQGGIIQAQGPKLTKNNINITGAMAFRATAANTAVDLNVYSTRNYTYNTQFLNNLQIPFLPAIAKIVNWQEVDPYTPIATLIAAQNPAPAGTPGG